MAVILGLLGMTSLAMRHNQLGREVSRLTGLKVELADQNRRLKADMDSLTVLEDLEAVARERLGLVSPSKGQIEIIE
jgi:cell division protein FtsL